MIRQNVGRLDRTLRLAAGVALIPIGPFLLNDLQGNPIGIVVAALGLVLLVTGLTGFCPGYVPFGITTLAEHGIGSALHEHVDDAGTPVPGGVLK